METILILMSTYNGEKYLEQQLDSIYNQVGVHVKVLVRDDGSSDRTLDILEKYRASNGLKWYSGKNLGPAYSFLDLISHSEKEKYYAFSDQDDVWNRDKLQRAINALKQQNSLAPLLYASNYQLVDQALNPLPENHHVTTTTFNAAVVSSCCTGCTMVFNDKLANQVNKATPSYLVMHDDWIHKLCLALDGIVVYDDAKTLLYRQHGNNADGGVHSTTSKLKNIIHRITSHECIRSKQLQEMFRIYGSQMNSEKRNILASVAQYRSHSLLDRLRLISSPVIRTPYSHLNKGFRLAVFLKYF